LNDNLREAGASGEHLTHGYGYEAVKLEVWREIDRCLDIDTREFTFVDLGSGKGRALILASLQGYKKVIGVEFARDLYTASIDNLDQFRRRTPSAPPVEILCQDAATFRFPDAKLVLFLFNPFDDTVLAKVVENLEESLRNVPRRAIVIYRNPVHSAVLLQSSLTLVKTVRMYSASKISFEIYTNGQDR